MAEKAKAITEIFSYYVIVIILCIIFGLQINDYFNTYITLLLSDVFGTILIWGIGIFKKTASLYDPYWSVAPIVMALSLIIYYNNFSGMVLLIFISMTIWSIRLTLNFTLDFSSFSYEDYRYKLLREKFGSLFQIVNFFGICLFPTLIVYSAMIPFISLVQKVSAYNSLFIIGVCVINLGTLLSLISDIQSRKFRKTRKSKAELNRTGLWKYSRHPNYLGEILVWWGLYLSVILIGGFSPFIITGTILNTCLFLFISIPMAENHLKTYKTDYEIYKKETNMLLPIKLF